MSRAQSLQEKQHNTTTTHYRIITSKTLQELLMLHFISELENLYLRHLNVFCQLSLHLLL